MKRGNVHFLRSISPFVVLIAAWLWVRNADGGDVAALFLPRGHICGVVSSQGQIMLVLTNATLDDRRAWTLRTAWIPDEQAAELRQILVEDAHPKFGGRPTGWHWDRAGFTLAVGNRNSFDVPGLWHRAFGVPHWLLILLCLAVPARAFVGFAKRRRRAKRGLCVNCGYDLRASGDRCPECGQERTGTVTPESSAARHHSIGA